VVALHTHLVGSRGGAARASDRVAWWRCTLISTGSRGGAARTSRRGRVVALHAHLIGSRGGAARAVFFF